MLPAQRHGSEQCLSTIGTLAAEVGEVVLPSTTSRIPLTLFCSSAALHLRRPSPFCSARLHSTNESLSVPDPLSDEFNVRIRLHDVTQRFTTSPSSSERLFESLIPPPLRVVSTSSGISMSSATLYTALHPLFTSSDVCAGPILDDQSSRLFHIIANSAIVIIDHFARLNEDNKIISIWMAAERVLEAGLVWATYLMSQRNLTPSGEHYFPPLGSRATMGPVLKVSSLLASFTARWKSGSAYVD